MKVKKAKTPGPSVFSKAVSNVTKIIKTKDAKAIKKEGSKKSSKQKLKLIKKEIPDEAVKKVKKTIKKETEVVKKEVSGKPSKKNLQLAKKKPSTKAVKSLVKTTKKNGKKTPKKSKEESNVEVYRKPVMYIGHIPHGFYESEMKEYFEQFGTVTQVRVARSKKTGKSRGYGYIEFEDKDVAKIAAETMNNYLMCGRLLKAHLIPDEKYHKRFFSGIPWTEKIYPKMTNRVSELRKNESAISEKNLKKNTKKSLKKLAELEATLKNVGIKIKFKPRNVPK